MADVMVSYPAATTAVGVPNVLALEDMTGNNLVLLGNGNLITPAHDGLLAMPPFTNEYSLTLSLSGANGYYSTAQLLGVTLDRNGNPVSTPALVGFNCYASRPTAAQFAVSNPNDMINYPAFTSGLVVADVDNEGLITAHHVGTCTIEVGVVTGNGDRLSIGQMQSNIIVKVIL